MAGRGGTGMAGRDEARARQGLFGAQQREDSRVIARDESIQTAVDAVYQLTEELQRGEILMHTAIEQVLGIKPHEGRWDHIINKVRRRMEKERGIATWYSVTVGYKLLTEVETLRDLPVIRMKKAKRQIRRAKRSILALPESGLTMNQRKARHVQIALLGDQERGLRRDLKEQDALLTLRPMAPRRPVEST